MIDASFRSALAICDHCGRRSIHADYDAARKALARHEAHAHSSQQSARHAVICAETRRRLANGEHPR